MQLETKRHLKGNLCFTDHHCLFSDPPTVSIDGYDNNWYVGRSDAVLLCLANANPAPNVTWTS